MNKIFLDDNTILSKPQVATIGFFDGVHRGHRYLIDQVVNEAGRSGMESAVITFDEHPRKVLHQDYQPRLLSTLETKLILLSRTKVDNAVVLHFDRVMASLSARDFMEKVLKDRLNVRKLIIGYDNRFGHDRSEGFDDYVRFGREMGIEVIRSQAFSLNGVNVSSSYIRKLIEGENWSWPTTVLAMPTPSSAKSSPDTVKAVSSASPLPTSIRRSPVSSFPPSASMACGSVWSSQWR